MEFNKFAAAVFLTGILAMIVGFVAEALYQPELNPEERGYQVAVAEGGQQTAGKQEKKEEKLDIARLMANASVEAGEKLTKKCVSCHTFEQGGPNKMGPNLWNVVGRPMGGKADFDRYSDAMKAKGGTWDYEALFKFLKKPRDYIPGTGMIFAGLKKPEDRADIVAYLRSISTDLPPLPPPLEQQEDLPEEETEAEMTEDAPEEAEAEEASPDGEASETE